MDKALLLCIWLAAGFVLLLGVVILHLRSKTALSLNIRGLGVEISIRSGKDSVSSSTAERLEE